MSGEKRDNVYFRRRTAHYALLAYLLAAACFGIGLAIGLLTNWSPTGGWVGGALWALGIFLLMAAGAATYDWLTWWSNYQRPGRAGGSE